MACSSSNRNCASDFGQLGLADAGWPEEHERADRPVRILQARPGAPHGPRHGFDRFGLADDALAELAFHGEQLLALAFEHAIDRDAGPAAHDLGDVRGLHDFLDHRVVGLAVAVRILGRLDAALEVGMTP